VAKTGSIFFNVAHSNGNLFTTSVSTTSGSRLWEYDLGYWGYQNVPKNMRPFGPAYANERVESIRSNLSSSASPIDVLNANNGAYISSPTFQAQGYKGGVATPVGNDLFFSAGYYGNEVYSVNAATGAKNWSNVYTKQYGGYVMYGESVSADQSYVYFFNAGSLFVLQRDGQLIKSITNQFFSKNGLSYFGEYDGAPILDGNGHIFTFTDNYVDDSTYPLNGTALPIAGFSLASDNAVWRSSHSYVGQPAVHGNKLYAVRASSTIVDALDVDTGLIVASVDVGGSDNLTSNVVLTDSHMFVSSNKTVFAISLNNTNLPVVWTSPFGGRIAITPEDYLIVTTFTGIHAVKLTK
jgi:hypothetical protein